MQNLGITIIKNSFLAFSAKAFNQLSYAVVLIIISRNFGPDEAGVYSLAIRYTSLFLILSIWGMDALLIREVSKDRSNSYRFLINYGVLRICFGMISIIILYLLLFSIMDYRHEVAIIISLLALSIIPESINSLVQAIYIAHEIYLYPTVVSICVGFTRILFGIWIIVYLERLALLIPLFILASSVGTIFYLSLILFFKKLPKNVNDQKVKFSHKSWREIIDWVFIYEQFKLSFPFALANFFVVIGWQIDIIILSIFVSDAELGYFAAAQTIASILIFIQFGYYAAIYPLLSRLYIESREELWAVYTKLLRFTGIVFVSITLLLTLLSEPIINIIFTPLFSPSVILLQWIVWGAVILIINEPNSRLMVIGNHQKVITLFLAISVFLNIFMNILFIPRFGVIGAVWAGIISRTLFAIINGFYVYQNISHINPLSTILKLTIAAIIALGLIYYLQYQVLWFNAILAILIYFLLLYLTGLISKRDFMAIRNGINNFLGAN